MSSTDGSLRRPAHDRVQEAAQDPGTVAVERLPELSVVAAIGLGDRWQPEHERTIDQVAAPQELVDAVQDDRALGVDDAALVGG